MRFPLANPPYDDKVQQAFDKVDLGPLSPQNFLRVLAHQPRLMGNVIALGGSLMYRGALSERLREIVILRVAVRTRCDYEWATHRALFEQRCNITREELDALRHAAPSAPCWTDQERLLIAAVDELHRESTISGATWEGMSRQWGPAELLEIIILIGHYHLVAFFMNATEAPPEDGARHLTLSEPRPGGEA